MSRYLWRGEPNQAENVAGNEADEMLCGRSVAVVPSVFKLIDTIISV